jgi:hypothetical protein
MYVFFYKTPVYIKIKNVLKINNLLNEVNDSVCMSMCV